MLRPAASRCRHDPPEPAITHARALDPVLSRGPCLLAVAAPREVRAVLEGLGRAGEETPAPWAPTPLDDRLTLVVTGVGKTNAAGAVARAASGCSGVLVLGLAGALPGPRCPSVGQAVLADRCVLADDGLLTQDGFTSQSGLGFPALEGAGETFVTDSAWADALRPLADAVGPCATVSACSGTDAAAAEIARRTDALCEDMESAAAALAAARLGLPFAALRVISNRTGDRAQQAWDLDRAFSVLVRLAAVL